MNVSARNVFKGKITALVDGAVNAEIEIILRCFSVNEFLEPISF